MVGSGTHRCRHQRGRVSYPFGIRLTASRKWILGSILPETFESIYFMLHAFLAIVSIPADRGAHPTVAD